MITVSAAPTLASLGLVIAPEGTATLSNDVPPVASFMITGGSVDGSDAIIEHDGSGLTFTKSGIDPLFVGNFRIDTAASLIQGDVRIGDFQAQAAGLFNIGPGLTLIVRPETAQLFSSAFGAPDLTGAIFGTAMTNPIVADAAVPESATWLMLIAGFMATGLALRRSNDAEMRFKRGDLAIVTAGRVGRVERDLL